MRLQIIISAYVKFDNIQVVFSRTERWIWAHIHKESFLFFLRYFLILTFWFLLKVIVSLNSLIHYINELRQGGRNLK